MAKATFCQKGENIDFKNNGPAKIEAGEVVLFGTKIGVAGGEIPVGGLGALIMSGVFSFPKSTEAINAGAIVFWDNTNKVITTTAAGNTQVGWATRPTATTDTEVLVNIN